MSGFLDKLGVNPESMECQMRDAASKETRYWLENDSKFRAVEQKVPTYEHFRQMVIGSHLSGLTQKEMCELGVRKSGHWNATKTGYDTTTKIDCTSSLIKKKNIQTEQEFIRCWNQFKNDSETSSKLQFLLCQEISLIQKIVNNGSAVSILCDLLSTLKTSKCFDADLALNTESLEESQTIFKILHSITSSKQFEFNALLFSGEELQCIEAIYSSLGLLQSLYSNRNIDSSNLKSIRDLMHLACPHLDKLSLEISD